ncbi:hypothetical protein EDC01DRAFT_630106 [Geopyxis carbonaria]|nr:hypothetical protein EDC01DRAFT_630106 [Geopyxis carbonaria]
MLRIYQGLPNHLRMCALRQKTIKRSYSSDNKKNTTHVTEKTHELDIQSHSSKQAQRERQVSKDNPENRGPKKDPKEGHPKAPEPVIGMQDERGGKAILYLPNSTMSSI